MEKRCSKTAPNDLCVADGAGSSRNHREELASFPDHLAVVEGSSTFPPIIVLVPDQVTFGRVMDQLLPAELAQASRQAANVVQMPPVRAKAFHDQPTFTFGEITVNMPAMEVRRNGKPVEMPMKEFSMMVYLVKNAGRVVARNELLNEVWGYNSYPCTRTVDNHILRLRRKLEVDPSRPKHFLTIHCAGYKFLP